MFCGFAKNGENYNLASEPRLVERSNNYLWSGRNKKISRDCWHQLFETNICWCPQSLCLKYKLKIGKHFNYSLEARLAVRTRNLHQASSPHSQDFIWTNIWNPQLHALNFNQTHSHWTPKRKKTHDSNIHSQRLREEGFCLSPSSATSITWNMTQHRLHFAFARRFGGSMINKLVIEPASTPAERNRPSTPHYSPIMKENFYAICRRTKAFCFKRAPCHSDKPRPLLDPIAIWLRKFFIQKWKSFFFSLIVIN